MVAALCLIYIVSIVDRYVISILVTPIKADLGLSDSQMGLILGPAFSFVYAAFGVPLGWATDRFSRRWVIFLGTILFACACISSAAAYSFAGLFLARAFVAIGEASLSPAAYSLISEKFPRNQVTTASAVYNTASRLGYAVAYGVGGLAVGLLGGGLIALPLLGAMEPWRVIFLATGAPALLLAFLAFTFSEDSRTVRRERERGETPSATLYMRRNWRLMLPLMVGLTFDGITSSALATWIPTYLTRHFAAPAEMFGPILGVISLVSAITLIFKGVLVDWLYTFGRKDIHIRFYTWLVMGFMPIAAAMFFIQNATVFLILYGLIQAFALTSIVFITATVQLVVPPSLKGRTIGIFLMVLSVLGIGTGPLIVGFLTDFVFRDDMKIGWSLATIVCTALPLSLISYRLSLRPLSGAMIDAEEAHARSVSG